MENTQTMMRIIIKMTTTKGLTSNEFRKLRELILIKANLEQLELLYPEFDKQMNRLRRERIYCDCGNKKLENCNVCSECL